MCKVVEERAKEYAAEALEKEKIENIKRMLSLGKLTHEEIANSLNVPTELVENVANGKVA